MRSLIYSSAGTTCPVSYDMTRSVPLTDDHLPPPQPLPHSDLPIMNTRDNHSIPPCQPHSFFNIHNNFLMLSSFKKDSITRAIQAGWAESTLKQYTGTIKQFIRFCDAEHVPEHLHFPADEFILWPSLLLVSRDMLVGPPNVIFQP